tara:strand:- start:1394 stop:2263 length:870 start_codon:yes stop_codon:yes gene_type:complete
VKLKTIIEIKILLTIFYFPRVLVVAHWPLFLTAKSLEQMGCHTFCGQLDTGNFLPKIPFMSAKQRGLVAVSILLTILGILFYTTRNSENSLEQKDFANQEQNDSSVVNALKAPSNLKTASQDKSKDSPSAAAANKLPPSNKELEDWLQKESKDLTRMPDFNEKEFQEKVEGLTPENLETLKKISLSEKREANLRVLSLYMLGQNSGAGVYLEDFLKQPIPLSPQAAPHSVDEMKNQREKALRVMALERKIAAAPSKKAAKNELQGLLGQINDPWLRDFIQRRLAELASE